MICGNHVKGTRASFSKNCSSLRFLAHRSRRLEWAIVIAHRPSSVRRRPSVNFSHFRLLLQNRWMDFDETWLRWSTHGPFQVLLFFYQIRQGRCQNRSRGGGGCPVLQETSSDRKATTTSQKDGNDLEACGKKCCYFLFHSEVKFLRRFDAFLDLVIFVYFNATLIDFYAVKSFICISFVLFPCFYEGKCWYQRFLNTWRILINFYVFI